MYTLQTTTTCLNGCDKSYTCSKHHYKSIFLLMIMYCIYRQEIQLMKCCVLNNLVPVYLNGSMRFENV